MQTAVDDDDDDDDDDDEVQMNFNDDRIMYLMKKLSSVDTIIYSRSDLH